MRGANTLFADVFPISEPEKQRKGRSISLNADRNRCLIDRYVFYARTTGFRYELIIRILSKEFFLSEVTVPEIIDDNYHLLQESRKASDAKDDLRKRWPHLHWGAPVIELEA